MALEISFAILLFLGLLLTCVPTLPGVPVMFGTIFVYALLDHFQTLQAWQLAIFGALALLSILIDYTSGLIGAKLGGANRTSLLFGVLGLFVGLLALPPLGAFLGLFLGVFVAELVQFKDRQRALKAASYSLATTVAGALTNILIAVIIFVFFMIIIL